MPGPVIDRGAVEHLAKLAALSLADGEADALAADLRAIVGYVNELQAVDTSDVPRESTVAVPAWREDVVREGLSHNEALAGAPGATEAGFAVPAFVKGGGKR